MRVDPPVMDGQSFSAEVHRHVTFKRIGFFNETKKTLINFNCRGFSISSYCSINWNYNFMHSWSVMHGNATVLGPQFCQMKSKSRQSSTDRHLKEIL
jgi:hypothetical protein